MNSVKGGGRFIDDSILIPPHPLIFSSRAWFAILKAGHPGKTNVVDLAQTAACVEQMCFSQSHKQLRPSLAWPMWAGRISQVKPETQGQLHSVPVF